MNWYIRKLVGIGWEGHYIDARTGKWDATGRFLTATEAQTEALYYVVFTARYGNKGRS